MKTCTKCCVEYPETPEFFNIRSDSGKLRNECKKCQSKYLNKYRKENCNKCKKKAMEWHIKNKSRVKAYQKQWRKSNVDHLNNEKRKWLKLNPKKRKESVKKYDKKRRSTPFGILNQSMSHSIYLALRKNKNGRKWESLVDFTLNQLKSNLEKQFTDGMSWDNYGDWHVDHKIPVSAFNFTEPEHIDFKRCWALENLQPMWANENIKKGASLEKPFQPSLPI